MSSEPEPETAFEWLRATLGSPDVLGLWVYGSFLVAPTTAADVDLIAMYRDGRTTEAVQQRRLTEHAFNQCFRMPLHAIFLSEHEFHEEAGILNELLACSLRLR